MWESIQNHTNHKSSHFWLTHLVASERGSKGAFYTVQGLRRNRIKGGPYGTHLTKEPGEFVKVKGGEANLKKQRSEI